MLRPSFLSIDCCSGANVSSRAGEMECLVVSSDYQIERRSADHLYTHTLSQGRSLGALVATMSWPFTRM